MGTKIVVIGGTAAGLSAAAKAKRSRPDFDVTVFEKSGYVSYGSCGLPYFIGGLIKEPEDLIELSVEQLNGKRGIKTYIHHEVTAIDRENKRIKVKNLESGEDFYEAYDNLVIATGGRPVKPPIPGIDLKRVYFLRTIEDGIAIKSAVKAGSKRAVIIGGGLIGLELAEQLCENGVKVEIIEALPRLLPFLPEEYSAAVLKTLVDKGINVHTGVSVTGFEGEGESMRLVRTDSGMELESDMAIVSIGSAPESSLAIECGIETGVKKAIVVDEGLKTNDPFIWACGDCVQTKNILTNEPVYVPLGTTANKQGRIAGGNIAGGQDAFNGVLASTVTKVFELFIASTGLSAEAAAKAGFDAASASIIKSDRASYYPGGTDNHLTLVFEKKGGRLLGAQGIGGVSVAGRINVLVAAITAGLTVKQLYELDLVYSPSAAPVYDPIIIAAGQALKYVE